MICIPYIVNNNYKIARMGTQQDAPPFYIIDINSNIVELFHFEEKFFAFDPNSGMGENGEKDYVFNVVKDQCAVVSVDTFVHTAKIKIAIKKAHPDAKSNPKSCQYKNPEGLSIDGNKIRYNLQKIDHKSDCVSTIMVTLFDVEEEGLDYTFGINVTQTDNIYDIVIDFGSEASQIWTNQRSLASGNIGNQMPLFANIKAADSTLTSSSNDDIYQYDASDGNLFRSLFFIKKNISKNSIDQADLQFINKTSDLLAMLANMVALPNLKLMDHDEVYLPNFTFNGALTNIFTKSSEIRAEILKFFFKIALQQVNKLAGNGQVACKLTFLVPNTYMQATLSSVHNQLMKDINDLFATAPPTTGNGGEAPYSQIKPGVEVTTFSESDASFFGTYSATRYAPSQRGQLVLIIDIGKGTTDFSVLCVKDGVGRVEVERQARSGFVGAGNVMTFAILVSMVKQFADKLGNATEANVYDAIKDLAYHSDYAKKNQLYGYLEELKRQKPMNGRTGLAQFVKDYNTETLKDIKAVNIDKWIEILAEVCNRHCFVDEDDVVVLAYAYVMAKRLGSELRYVFDESKKIDKLIFSGRGAKSKALKKSIEQEVKGLMKGDDVEILNDIDIKTGCLKGPLNEMLRMDHANLPMVGWPVQIKLQPIECKKSKHKHRGLKAIFNNFFNDDEERGTAADMSEEEEFRRELQRTRRIALPSSGMMSKIQGLPVNINKEGNCFVLGNRRCVADINENELGLKYIYFDGEEFKARDENNSYKFVYDRNETDESFITETLFPMTGGNNARINMTGVTEVLQIALARTQKPEESDGNGTATAASHIEDDDDFAV